MRVVKFGTRVSEKRWVELVKEKEVNYEASRTKQFDSPKEIAKLMNDVLDLKHQADEYVYMLCLDIKLHLIGIIELSHGGTSRASLSMNNILTKALLIGASGIVLVHNHPSGDTTPSLTDIKVTKEIKS